MRNSLIKSSLNVYIAGYGCCKQEIIASAGPVYDVSRFGVSFVSYPENADVLVFQGFYNGKGLKKIINIYGDSMLVINQMTGKWKIKSGYYVDYATECKKFLKLFTNINLKWIPREENTYADNLSKGIFSNKIKNPA